MKASISWLKNFFSIDLPIEEMISRLTMAGLEVDGVENASNEFSDVFVGSIQKVEPHPNAEKLKVCQVTDGVDLFQVVCGAANARVGLIVPFAKPGAILGKDIKIKRAKLRGIESHGMLCGADELGLADERTGLMELPQNAPIGMAFGAWLSLPDQILDIDLTPNRGDCLSLTGLGRELAVLTSTDFHSVPHRVVNPVTDEILSVVLENPEGCPIYVGRVISDVDITRTTPIWMIERLRRSGIRSVDVIVDITNYVMLELGQPMHAFDRNLLDGEITVRFAEEGETLTLLDGKILILSSDVLIIADDKKPLALAGIMGGVHSGISNKTTTIFLESAFFNPVIIAGKARRYALNTEASTRYERGVDWRLPQRACERATELVQEICGGRPGPVVVTEVVDALPAIKTVYLSSARIKQQLNITLETDNVCLILESLGFSVSIVDGGFECLVPSWRFDVSIEQDLIEELARIYGYNNLPISLPAQALSMADIPETQTPQARLKAYLVDQDIQEVITYSFVAADAQKSLGDGCNGIRLANPIASTMAEMRRSLFPGLVDAVRYNVNRQLTRVRLFEIGQCFVQQNSEIDQSEYLGLAIYGQAEPINYTGSRLVDFFDLKGFIDGLVQLNGGKILEFVAGVHPALAEGQTADIFLEGQHIGVMGRLTPRLARDLDLPKPLYLANLRLAQLLNGQVTAFKAISRYPRVTRDLAILVDQDITWNQITEVVGRLGESCIQSVDLFDVYTGRGVPDGKKSLALSLCLQDRDTTLDDVAIQGMVEKVIDALQSCLHAELRG